MLADELAGLGDKVLVARARRLQEEQAGYELACVVEELCVRVTARSLPPRGVDEQEGGLIVLLAGAFATLIGVALYWLLGIALGAVLSRLLG